MSFIEYIKENYTLILIILSVLIIGLLLLFSFFKVRITKNRRGLQVSNEGSDLSQIYKKCFVIFRKNIQEYQIYLYNENGEVILRSEPQSSLLTTKSILADLKKAIQNSQVWITKDIYNHEIGVFTDKHKQLGITKPYKNIDDFNKQYHNYQLLINSEIKKEVIKYDLITEFISDIMPKNKVNKKNWIFDESDGYYSYKLFDENNIILFTTFRMFDKKKAKEHYKEAVDSIKNKRFIIEYDKNDKSYQYVLRNKNNETLSYGKKYETIVEVRNEIIKIIELS